MGKTVTHGQLILIMILYSVCLYVWVNPFSEATNNTIEDQHFQDVEAIYEQMRKLSIIDIKILNKIKENENNIRKN